MPTAQKEDGRHTAHQKHRSVLREEKKRETHPAVFRVESGDQIEKGASLDGEYYCFHHPEVKVEELKVSCECRKPKPGLLIQAAKEMDINLSRAWMIVDDLTDVEAGQCAGTRTALLGRMKCELCHLMDEEGARPDVICLDLIEVARKIGV